MEARERESAARVARGARPLDMPEAWSERPRLDPAEEALFLEFVRFWQFAGDDPRPTDALAWFEMRAVAPAERPWLAEVFAAMSAVAREKVNRG
jgi:hypothetical protein